MKSYIPNQVKLQPEDPERLPLEPEIQKFVGGEQRILVLAARAGVPPPHLGWPKLLLNY